MRILSLQSSRNACALFARRLDRRNKEDATLECASLLDFPSRTQLTSLSQRELYENMCMRAVNQSIGTSLGRCRSNRAHRHAGRAIRHKGDWAALIFVDTRFSSARVRAKLPGWISADLTTPETYGKAAAQLAKFYRSKI